MPKRKLSVSRPSVLKWNASRLRKRPKKKLIKKLKSKLSAKLPRRLNRSESRQKESQLSLPLQKRPRMTSQRN